MWFFKVSYCRSGSVLSFGIDTHAGASELGLWMILVDDENTKVPTRLGSFLSPSYFLRA